MFINAFALAVGACVSLVACPRVMAADTWTDIIPGVRYLYRTTNTPRPIQVYALTVDVTNPRVRIGTTLKRDTNTPGSPGETTSSMAKRHGAFAAINGDYFEFSGATSYIPQGIQMVDRFKISGSGFVPGRLSWAMSAGTLESFMNVYATQYPNPQFPAGMASVLSGGPRSVRNGVVSIENTAGLPSASSLYWRTGLGISQDKHHLILAVVVPQTGYTDGVSAAEFGSILIGLGAYDAMNFDSGGSSTFYLAPSVRNPLKDGSERQVTNALCVYDTFDPGPNPVVTIGTGFENPPFLLGTINSQQSWSGSNAHVENAHAKTGSQGMQIDPGGSAERTFTTTTDKVQWIDFWAKREGGKGTSSIYFGPSPGVIFGKVGFTSSGVGFYAGNRIGNAYWQYVGPYSTGEWHRFSIRVDYNAVSYPSTNVHSYDVYIDGVLCQLGNTYIDSGSDTNLGWIKFDDNSPGSMIIDDLYIGTVPFDFPRVEPDSATVPQNGYRQFVMKNASSVSSWQILDERNPSNVAVPAGTIASINSAGIVTANALGSFIVKATDNIGKQDQTLRINVVPSITVASARAVLPGQSATIGDSVVTGIFPDHIYVEQLDRASGIRINTLQPVALYDRISALGTIQNENGEVVLTSSSVLRGPAGTSPGVLSMSNHQITRGITPGQPYGLDPAGLLVQIFGKVTRIESDRFYVQDGGVPGDGLVVLWPSFAAGNLNKMITVVGPVGAYFDGANWIAAIKPRTGVGGDIVLKN